MVEKGSVIAVGSDHAGFGMKSHLIKVLEGLGYQVDDKGTYDSASCDYPDFAVPVAQAVAGGSAAAGVLVCSTGIGISITANKVKGIRAALVHHAYEAQMCRRHNDANIICFGANITGPAIAEEALKAFLTTDFEGGRHQRRIDKMMAVEKLSF